MRLRSVPPLPPPFPTATLRALVDRLIPADDFPGALATGADRYARLHMENTAATESALLIAGLHQLDRETAERHDTSFAALDELGQDALLTELEKGRTATAWPEGVVPAAFFARMVDLAHEGFYADATNGGNRDEASWKMIGYDPRIPSDHVPPEPESHD